MASTERIAARPTSRRSGKLVEVVLEHLRSEILAGRRSAGQRVQESVLAQELGMSRAPVREALRMLEQSGLLVKNPNYSYTVRSFTDHDLYELATLRITLESFAAELAFAREETFCRLQAPLEAMREAEVAGDVAAAFQADQRFHRTLVDCAEHSRLTRSYALLLDEIELALHSIDRRQPALEGSAARHAELAQHFKDGSLDELLRDLSAHIRSGSGFSPLATYLTATAEAAASARPVESNAT